MKIKSFYDYCEHHCRAEKYFACKGCRVKRMADDDEGEWLLRINEEEEEEEYERCKY